MPKQPKPFFRKQTKSWYFSPQGKQFNLGKHREQAFAKFHQMMADPTTIAPEHCQILVVQCAAINGRAAPRRSKV